MQQRKSLVDRIANVENLILAWRKVEQSFHHGDVWFDEIEISKFKFKMIDHVKRIHQELMNGSYQLKPLLPAPFPKGKDVDGGLQVRQSFLVNVEDQVVWMAVVNVIGPVFEKMMPAWSYGNRLNRMIWKENGEWKFGNIRKSSTRTYRKWNQSWPLFRKQLSASIKAMAFANLKEAPALTIEVQQIVNENNSIADNLGLKLPYLAKDYFPTKENKMEGKLYWVGIDLEKFYQYAKLKDIGKAICNYYCDDESFCQLIEKLSDFKLDTLDYTADELAMIQLELDKPFEGLPTGLVVAGFLANVFLLDIDMVIEEKLKVNRNTIHFRYVDDHVFVSLDSVELYKWVKEYDNLIQNKGLKINFDKIEPKGLTALFKGEEVSEEEVKEQMANAALDPFYPSPLMTETLQKVSELSGLNLDLLSDQEFDMVFKDLQMLMVADIPEQEIKKNTRVSFACSMLTRMVADWDCDLEKVYELRKQWVERVDKLVSQNKVTDDQIQSMYQLGFSNGSTDGFDTLTEKLKGLGLDFSTIDSLKNELQEGNKKSKSKKEKIYRLLTKAIMEIPDKSKIWVRAFDYCALNLPEKIVDLYKFLAHIEKEDILHSLGCEYLYAMFHLRMAHNIVRAINRLLENNYVSPEQHNIDKVFLKSVSEIIPKQEGHYLISDSLKILNKAKLLNKAFAEQLGMSPLEIDGDFGDEVKYRSGLLSFNFWMLWGLELINSKMPTADLKMKTVFGRYVSRICPEKDFFLPLICRCLMEFQRADFDSITFEKKFELPKMFNSFEFFYVVSNLREAKNFGLNFVGYEAFEKKFKTVDSSNKVTIEKWLSFLSVEADKDTEFQLDVRNSELMSTKIALAIAKSAYAKLGDKLIVIIHPLSISLSVIWENGKKINICAENSWYSWRDRDVLVEFSKDKLINSSCYYYPASVLGNVLHKEDAMVYAIGMLFLQLLTKQKVLPWIVYRPEFGFEWESVLMKLLQTGGISSKNYKIVRSCLSAHNREILDMLRNDEDYIPTTFDGTTYMGLADLIKDLEESIVSMKDNLVSVANQEARQLTVINL